MMTCVNCDINFLQRKAELIKTSDGYICTDCNAVRNDKNRAKYWNGPKNKIIRFYFYSTRGLALLNEARYLIMGVFALYYTLKLDNPVYLIGMFAVAIPVLIALGWLSVHHIGKVVDWLNIQFSTHFGRYQYTLLEEIRDAVRANSENGNSGNNIRKSADVL
jgi:hypothetical protein